MLNVSGVGSYFSVFHNTRCAYPTTVMHEIAHNLGKKTMAPANFFFFFALQLFNV